MFACPLFREVDENAKLKGANYDSTRRSGSLLKNYNLHITEQ